MNPNTQLDVHAQLDVDVLALQQDDTVTCLLTFDAPVPDDADTRPGETVVVVVDRSGSMSGAPLEAVRASLHALVDRMKPQDSFGVVTFDSTAHVAVPCRPISDHHVPTIHDLIEGIHPGGTTDLSAGYLLGLSEARRHLGATGASVLLLSDGHANAGITDPAALGSVARTAHGGGGDTAIVTTTIGIGSGYDESLLEAIAVAGSGTHRFAFSPDDAAAVLAEEAGDLLSKSIVNTFVRIRPSSPSLLAGIGTLHDVPRWVETDESGAEVVVIPLGDLYAGEQRELLVQFAVPAVSSLGLMTLATLTFDCVALPAFEAQSITWPVSVNVVPGDEAAGRVPHPTVTVARLLAETARVKKDASDALLQGDGARAATSMDAQAGRLRAAASSVPDSAPNADLLRRRLAEEETQAAKLARSARERDAMTSRKSFVEDVSFQMRGRNDEQRMRRARGRRAF